MVWKDLFWIWKDLEGWGRIWKLFWGFGKDFFRFGRRPVLVHERGGLLVHDFHASPATSWKPSRNFIKISEPQKIDFQHQVFTKKLISSTKKWISSTKKKWFPTPFSCFRAPTSRCTKMARTHLCTRFAPVGKNRAPPPPPCTQNWPNVLSQPRASQYIRTFRYVYMR